MGPFPSLKLRTDMMIFHEQFLGKFYAKFLTFIPLISLNSSELMRDFSNLILGLYVNELRLIYLEDNLAGLPLGPPTKVLNKKAVFGLLNYVNAAAEK